MDGIYKQARCDGCNRILSDGDTVVALISDITVDRKMGKGFQNLMRLKLSPNSLETRTIKIYCKNCLELNNYLGKDKE